MFLLSRCWLLAGWYYYLLETSINHHYCQILNNYVAGDSLTTKKQEQPVSNSIIHDLLLLKLDMFIVLTLPFQAPGGCPSSNPQVAHPRYPAPGGSRFPNAGASLQGELPGGGGGAAGLSLKLKELALHGVDVEGAATPSRC